MHLQTSHRFIVAIGASALLACPLHAADAPPGQRAPLSSVEALFGAMASHDVATARRLLVPGAAFVVKKPDGSVAIQHDADFLDALGSSKSEWRERIWHPQVLIQGDLAQVWAPYDFHLDGTLSHCGVDSFSLVREDGIWRIAGISYTMQTQHCAPSPHDAATP